MSPFFIDFLIEDLGHLVSRRKSINWCVRRFLWGSFNLLGEAGYQLNKLLAFRLPKRSVKRPVHLSHSNNSLPLLVGYSRLYHVHGYTAELSRHQTNSSGNAPHSENSRSHSTHERTRWKGVESECAIIDYIGPRQCAIIDYTGPRPAASAASEESRNW